jgi:ubiquinone/menaquinone biosynthesis C-methylase UbiE
MSDPIQDHVRKLYDSQPEREWERMDRHRTEHAVTLRAMEAYLPPPPAHVLDCGGGPGRFAIELTRRGYQVTLFDLSGKALKLAREKASAAGVTLAGYEQGSATDLGRFPDEVFDAVLLMGPLYHLLEEEQRLQALAESVRVLKPGGPLFAAFITRYAGLRYYATNDPGWLHENPQKAEEALSTGVFPPEGKGDQEFVAYFAHPGEVTPLCREAGLEMVATLGVEGLVSMIEEKVNALSGAAWDAWADLNYGVAADPSIHGITEHLLAIAIKPRWRAVLRRVVKVLEAAGLPYKLVGGAAVAVHGVPLAVRDLDIELDADDAYRFQALFPEQVIQPVALSESETYRSHFGRLDFEGVIVEIMGSLQRREGKRWVPTRAQTEIIIPLGDLSVRVPWLEESTLTSIRRGRLDRAAQCLPHCDPGQLLSLLRGEQSIEVL